MRPSPLTHKETPTDNIYPNVRNTPGTPKTRISREKERYSDVGVPYGVHGARGESLLSMVGVEGGTTQLSVPDSDSVVTVEARAVSSINFAYLVSSSLRTLGLTNNYPVSSFKQR